MNLNKQFILDHSATIRDAMVRLNELATINGVLFITDPCNHLLGSVSDGDIRRSLIKGTEMLDPVAKAINKECVFFIGTHPHKEIIQSCKLKNIRFLPLLNADRQVIQVLDIVQALAVLPVEAVIMAGGEGKRLKPLTNNLPKPLLPIGEKPIIEHNIDRLIKYGISRIHISINYLGHMLRNYFSDGSAKNIEIEYIDEDQPMGTVGAVTKVENWKTDHLLIMNSDVLTDIDYADFYDDFVKSEADMSVAAIPYLVNIPYAVLETNEGNIVSGLSEKPEYTYYSNAGIYFLKKDLLKLIPKDCCYDMPDLINLLLSKNFKVVSYPIRSYWLDIGKINDYLKAQEDIKHLKL
jgi:dTDP-glucose pyrophosphorylase